MSIFKLKIGTLNVRGLGNRIKRKSLFQYFNDKNLNIVYMQEVHCNKKTTQLWQNESGWDWFSASGTNNSRGAVIMIKKGCDIKVVKYVCDHDGRTVICNIVSDQIHYTLCNLYAPNIDSPDFFLSTFKTLEKMGTENIIIGGDFNLTMNPDIDRYNSLHNNKNAAKFVENYMHDNNLCDVYRAQYPDTRRYTWFKRGAGSNVTQASRIDFFLVNNGLTLKVTKIEVSANNKTDHSLVQIKIDNCSFKRGLGIWKINNRLLYNEDYCKLIHDTIENTKKRSQKSGLDDKEKWEFIKDECQAVSKKFSKNQSKEKKILLNNLYALKQELLEDSIKNTVPLQDTINMVKCKIDSLEKEKVEGAIFRSRSQWTKDGEKMSRYFFALEKRNFTNKTMFSILLNDGTECKEQRKIREEQKFFYEELLYTSNPDIDFNIENSSGVKLTNVQRETLDRDFTLQELYLALKDMKADKVPGCDGLSTLFYIRFWEEIKEPLWNMYQQVLNTKLLGTSARKGIITLIPKRNKNSKILKNLRPLSILTNDYKILAKAMANRLKSVLPTIISDTQSGFMEGRNIQDNICQTMDVIAHINQSGKKAVVVSIDFQKCFDRIEHRSIYKAFEYFGFGERYIGWTSIFFNNITLMTQNGGFCSPPFIKGRGVNQGCNFSPFCYNVCGEIMSHLIKQNPAIKGINLCGKLETTRVITQFADDTGLFLMYSESCIKCSH